MNKGEVKTRLRMIKTGMLTSPLVMVVVRMLTNQYQNITTCL